MLIPRMSDFLRAGGSTCEAGDRGQSRASLFDALVGYSYAFPVAFAATFPRELGESEAILGIHSCGH